MAGTISLNDGTVALVALGQELHAVKARVTLTPDGAVRLDDGAASGTTGKVTFAGDAHLDGTALVGAQAHFQILKHDAMPVSAQGFDVGSVYGNFGVKVTTSSDRKAIQVTVDVPTVHVRLPEASTHSVQDLGEAPENNHVGVYTSPQRFVVLPMDGNGTSAARKAPPDGNSLAVSVHIGDAEIARGTDVRIGLGGDLTAKLAEKTDVTGHIVLRSGKLELQGKSFDVESGIVTFNGDASNPEIKVTAGWTAEDGTHVYADYVGPLKTGKVTLRSEPARPQNEILALIAFGTADGAQASSYEAPPVGGATTAGTTVGGFATAGLSKGLDKLTGLDITAKIDTSQANPRPEVELQIARNSALELAVVLGDPPPGTNQDTTYATIDWRFRKNWSLETTFGNVGARLPTRSGGEGTEGPAATGRRRV